jgi:haloacetate dehalogenase
VGAVAPTLAAHFTVVCADLRGYGDSAKPKCLPDRSNYAFRALANDQVGLMRQFGFERFHVVGHDRGGRTGHRMALDHPDVVLTLTVMDIVPTYAMFVDTNRHVAGAYWHWYFLSQPEPFPERLIGNDADFFYETCLIGWGATKIGDFDADMLAAYRRSWRDPAMIHGSCSDYRAAAGIDLEHDAADIDRKVACPTLVFYGAAGAMARLFDIATGWSFLRRSISRRDRADSTGVLDRPSMNAGRPLLSPCVSIAPSWAIERQRMTGVFGGPHISRLGALRRTPSSSPGANGRDDNRRRSSVAKRAIPPESSTRSHRPPGLG